MFVIACGFNISGVEDSRIRKFLPSRRQVRNRCHFDQREKSLLDPSHSLGMTGLGPSPLRPWGLCGRYSEFRLRLFADRRTSFPQRSLGKSVYCYISNFARRAQIYWRSEMQEHGELPPAKAQSTQSSEGRDQLSRRWIHRYFQNFAAFASLREIFRISVAALLR